MKKSGKNPKWVAAGKKSHVTRQVNVLKREYENATSPGVKSAIKKKINALTK